MDNMLFFDIMGWIGTAFVLIAYLLLSIGKIKNGYLYQILNLLAGTCMAIGLFPKDAWFSFTLQIVWSVVAIVAIIKLKLQPQKKSIKKK